jgi:hypothetical protein
VIFYTVHQKKCHSVFSRLVSLIGAPFPNAHVFPADRLRLAIRDTTRNRAASLLHLRDFITYATICRYEDVTAWKWNNQRTAKVFA